MISGVGASASLRRGAMVEDYAINDSMVYNKPLVSGSGGFKITSQSEGRVAFDLNDGYMMAIDESRSAISVTNSANIEKVAVWDIGKLALDGADLGQFAGTTSLVLDNGTKITMQTAPDIKAAEVFRLDKLTITNGECATVVCGVSSDVGGDLTVTNSSNGHSVDYDARDGLVLEENTLTGWADEYGIAVTPEMLAATMSGGEFGPGSERMSLEEFQALMARFLSWSFVSSMMSWSSQRLTSEAYRQDPNDVAKVSDLRRAWARHADEKAAATRAEIRHSEMRAR